MKGQMAGTVMMTTNNRSSQSGVALLIALFTLSTLAFLAVEIAFDPRLERAISNQNFRRTQAYYTAKSGIELSMLRILLYRKVLVQFGDQLKGQQKLTNMIWQFPFAWPIVPPKSVNRVESEEIGDAVSESLMGQNQGFTTSIESEGSKIDLNDLASPSEILQKVTRDQLISLFKNRADQDDDFADKLRNYDYETLVNNIKDWVDPDSESDNGGDESSPYSEINEENLPPNRSFRTLLEVRMVGGMDDEIFEFLSPSITVYGVKGINPNYADIKLLKSISEDITDEVAQEIINRRNDPERGPFADEEDFFGFLEAERVDTGKIEDEGIPLYYDAEYNFRIVSTGYSANVTRKITAIVYDFDTAKSRLIELLEKEDKDQDPDDKNPDDSGGTTATTTTTTTQPKPPKGKPNIVYWYET